MHTNSHTHTLTHTHMHTHRHTQDTHTGTYKTGTQLVYTAMWLGL